MMKYIKSILLLLIIFNVMGLSNAQEIIEYYPFLNNKTITYNDSTNVITYILNDTKLDYEEIYFFTNSSKARLNMIINDTEYESCDLTTNNNYFNLTIIWYEGREDIVPTPDSYNRCNTNILKIGKKNFKKIIIQLSTFSNSESYYYQQMFWNGSINQDITPNNLSSLDVSGEDLTFYFDLSFLSLPQDMIHKVYINHSYSINGIDGADIPPYIKIICDDDGLLSSIPECSESQYSFHVDLTNLLKDDNLKDTIHRIFDLQVLTRTPYEWLNYTFYYYLDDSDPFIDVEKSSFFPDNGSNVINQTYIELNLTLKDVRSDEYACSYVINNQLKGFINYNECSHFILNDLEQKDYIINLTVYDYANNSKNYFFVFKKDENLIDCYGNNKKCYYKGDLVGTITSDFVKRENLSLDEDIGVKWIINVNKTGINKVLFHATPYNLTNFKGCAEATYDNNLLICNNSIVSLEVDLKNITYRPLTYDIINITQDLSKQSELNGYSFIIANILIRNKDIDYVDVHDRFKNVSYDLKDYIEGMLNGYNAYESYKGYKDIENVTYIVVKLNGTYRLKSNYYYEDCYIKCDYVKCENISINRPLEVYLKQIVENKDNITFKNVKSNFPMKCHTVDLLNESSCSPIFPLFIDMSPLESKVIEVKYKCNVFRITTSQEKTHVYDNYLRYRYRIDINIPPLPNLFYQNSYVYDINTADLENFNNRDILLIYLDKLGNNLSYTINDGLLKIFIPYTTGAHTIFIDYWYKKKSKKRTITSITSNTASNEVVQNNTKSQDTQDNKNKNKKKDKDEIKNDLSLHSTKNVTINDLDNTTNQFNKTETYKKNIDEKAQRSFIGITGRFLEITSNKTFKLFTLIILIILIIIITIMYKKSRTNRRRLMNNNLIYLKNLKKEVL